jgi:2-polyprenyl-3-methyl-5-hydroxy-6-metoxy-1,4-benzoquinol methylase
LGGGRGGPGPAPRLLTAALSLPRPAYGTPEWLEAQYERGPGDPWGLDWRPSQDLRFAVMLDVLRAARPALPARPRVLDFGCATGDFTARLAGWLDEGGGGDLLAVDASARAVARARARVAGVRFEAWNAAESAAEGPFDLLTCLEVIYYVPAAERASFVSDLAALLRPGGLALFSSMAGRAPYLTADGLREAIGRAFEVRETEGLYVRPLAQAEKALMAVSRRATGDSRPPERWTRAFRRLVAPRRAAALARLSRRWLGSRAHSHSYVLGRKPA